MSVFAFLAGIVVGGLVMFVLALLYIVMTGLSRDGERVGLLNQLRREVARQQRDRAVVRAAAVRRVEIDAETRRVRAGR